MIRRILLILLCSSGAAFAQDAAPPAWTAVAGSAQLEVNRATASQYRIAIDVLDARALQPREDYERALVRLEGSLRFRIEHGHYALPAAGSIGPLRLVVRSGDRARELELRLVPGERRGDFALVDVRARRWFVAHDVHQSFDAAAGMLTMTHLDLRAGPELARWSGRAALGGRLVGGLHLRLVGARDASLAKGSSSCLPATWPGTPGRTTDVVLDALSSLDVYCNEAFSGGAGLCDGNGTNPNAKLKFLPSVRLSNGGTTDVPWYNKFAVSGPPAQDYPYATFDQHPFLVWNVYRLRADGRLDQIGRSGVKHAFFTSNDDCQCAGGAILFHGPRPSLPLSGQCSDTYDAMSNDLLGALGPRRELIARSGVFGRCESIFDPDCNGTQNPEDPNPESPALRYRAPVHESELSAALHPGARFFIESWYVVRDDANLYNTMRSREFTAAWLGFWDIDLLADGAPTGGVVDRWVAPGGAASDARNTEVVTASGRLKLAMRATPLGEGRYRYDYVVMNFDYADPVTSFAEPNLRVDRNRGIAGVRIPVSSATSTSLAEFHDGDTAAADWSAQRTAAQLEFAGGASSTLDWGSMYRYSFVADAPPIAGSVTLQPFEAGAPELVVATLVPGASEVLFASGFESP